MIRTMMLAWTLFAGMALDVEAQGERVPLVGVKGVKAANEFAFDLYSKVSKGEKGNVVYSPVGMHTLLSLIHEGAEGETLAELQGALHWRELSREQRFEEVLALRKALAPKAGGAQSIQAAQYLWLSQQRWLKPPFLKAAEEVYGITPRAMDFTQPEQAVREINAAVARDTRQRIPALLQAGSVSAQTSLMAASTLFFKGSWMAAFDVNRTRKWEFQTMVPAVKKQVMLMDQETELRGFMDEIWQAVEMPFSGNMDHFAMWLLLPRKHGGLAELEARFSAKLLGQVGKESKTRKVILRVPRFSFSMGGDFQGLLGSLGIKRVFQGESAQLEGISPAPPLRLAGFLHEATIEVNEIGSEASAATLVPMEPFGHNDVTKERDQTIPMVFQADHPFVFVIEHRQTGLIVFMGRVAAP